MLRIGFAGTGLIAWAHGLGLQAVIDAGLVEADISVVFDRSEKRAQGFAAHYGAEVVHDLSELAGRCDAIWVCTPTVAHRDAVDAALAGGRAVFCEKPLATDLSGARSLVAVVWLRERCDSSATVTRPATAPHSC